MISISNGFLVIVGAFFVGSLAGWWAHYESVRAANRSQQDPDAPLSQSDRLWPTDPDQAWSDLIAKTESRRRN